MVGVHGVSWVAEESVEFVRQAQWSVPDFTAARCSEILLL